MTRHPLIIPSLAAVLAVSILASAYLVARNGSYFFRSQASDIAVTGSTSMDFTSDLAVWQGQFTRKAMDLKEVYALMKQDKAVVEQFLKEKGIDRDAYAFLSIDIIPQNKTVNHYNDEGDLVDRESVFNGYRLKRVNEAEGDVARFSALLAEYNKAPEVTRRRIYIETLQDVLPGIRSKVVIDEQARSILPLLNLGARKGDQP